MDGLSETQAAHNREFLGKIIDENFTQQPSAAPAFAQMTAQLGEQIAADTARLTELRRMNVPLLLLWGKGETYLHVAVAEYLRSQARNAMVHTFDAGHWPQIDAAPDVARVMLENQ